MPIVTKLATRDPDTCVGCRYCDFQQINESGYTRARCVKFVKVIAPAWHDDERPPDLIPLQPGCKEPERPSL